MRNSTLLLLHLLPLLLLLLLLLLLQFVSSALAMKREAICGKDGALHCSKNTMAMAIPAMLVALQQRANHSWLLQLRPDPRQKQFEPNRTSREVFSGHYVEVQPMPLPQPSLIMHRCAVAPSCPPCPVTLPLLRQRGNGR